MKQELSAIEKTTSLGVNNVRNNEAMKVIFLIKLCKILCKLQKCNRKLWKMLVEDNCI